MYLDQQRAILFTKMLKFVVFNTKIADKRRKTVGNMFIKGKLMKLTDLLNLIIEAYERGYEKAVEDMELAEDDLETILDEFRFFIDDEQ